MSPCLRPFRDRQRPLNLRLKFPQRQQHPTSPSLTPPHSSKSMSLATEQGLAAMQRENQSQVTGTVAESLSLDMSNIVTDLRSTFNTGKTKSLQWRKQQLNQLTKLIKENYDEIFEAIGKDHLNSSGFRGIVDIAPAMGAISQAISNLDAWAADVPCKAPLFGDAFIRSEPKGVMLIIAPWNYPLAMVLDPLIPAIAAGNCVVIKPSEVSNHSSDVLFSLLNKYMARILQQVAVTFQQLTTSTATPLIFKGSFVQQVSSV